MRIEIFGRIVYEHYIVPYTQSQVIVLIFGKSRDKENEKQSTTTI